MKFKILPSLLLAFSGLFGQHAQAQEIKMVCNPSQLLGTSDYRLMESVEMNGTLFFTTWSAKGTQLWKTDGITSSLVFDWPLGSLGKDYAVNKLYVYQNHLLFTGIDATHGKELWISDGTAAGTRMLKDINPGSNSAFYDLYLVNTADVKNGPVTPFTEINGNMHFVALDASGKLNVWSTDGTSAGTVAKTLFNPYPDHGMLLHIGALGSKFLLTAMYETYDFGGYISDGTASGTTLLTDMKLFRDYFDFNGKLLFNEMTGNQLWTSDGTQSGTVPLSASPGCTADRVVLNNRLYFFTQENYQQFYSTDGTASGTSKIIDAPRGPAISSRFIRLDAQRYFPVVLGNSIYFAGSSEIWKSDGTAAGTSIAKSIPNNSGPVALTVAGNKLFYKAWDTSRVDLFVSDGTSAGTGKLSFTGSNYHDSDLMLGGPQTEKYPDENMIVVNNQLFFTEIYDKNVGKALYKIDLPATSVPLITGKGGALTVFPNPSSSIFTIRYPKDLYETASVYDVSGRVMHQQAINLHGEDVLKLPNLAPGQYFIRLNGSAPTISAPVLVCH